MSAKLCIWDGCDHEDWPCESEQVTEQHDIPCRSCRELAPSQYSSWRSAAERFIAFAGVRPASLTEMNLQGGWTEYILPRENLHFFHHPETNHFLKGFPGDAIDTSEESMAAAEKYDQMEFIRKHTVRCHREEIRRNWLDSRRWIVRNSFGAMRAVTSSIMLTRVTCHHEEAQSFYRFLDLPQKRDTERRCTLEFCKKDVLRSESWWLRCHVMSDQFRFVSPHGLRLTLDSRERLWSPATDVEQLMHYIGVPFEPRAAFILRVLSGQRCVAVNPNSVLAVTVGRFAKLFAHRVQALSKACSYLLPSTLCREVLAYVGDEEKKDTGGKSSRNTFSKKKNLVTFRL